MTMITAHSGCGSTAPNSMEYLRHALHTGADALEIDIRRGPEGKLVLSHDPVEKTPDRDRITNTEPSAGEDAGLVTLEKAFRFLADSSMKINCDLKGYGLEDDVRKTAQAAGIADDRLIFTGSVTDCMHARERLDGICVFINAEELIPGFYEPFLKGCPDLRVFRELTERCRQAGMDVLNINYRVCTEELLGLCRTEQIGLSVWTVDTPADMEKMMENGVLNLTTREPEEALRIRKRMGSV